MEKNNGKVIAIIALVVAVIALSAGFAAFTAVLNITNASATITANDTFEPQVNYVSESAKCYPTGDDTGTVTGAVPGNASGKIWSGISVPLTTTVPSVTCEATVENASSFIAYLKTITTSGPIVCSSVATGADAVTSTVISAVCGNQNTTMTVHVGNASPSSATDKIVVDNDDSNQAQTGTTNIAAKSNGTNGTQKVYVTVASTAAAIGQADGNIKVTLPYIELTYGTVANGS